jgi:TM2 domain-containing membrane protein YozV
MPGRFDPDDDHDDRPRRRPSRYRPPPRSPKSRAAYMVFGLFLGPTGLHNFYAGRTLTGCFQLAVFLPSLLLTLVLIGLVPLAVLWLWSLLEVFVVSRDGDGLTMH